MDGFFVLSGFLITCLLVQEWQKLGSINLSHFYIGRALRLFPALFVMLTVISLGTWFFATGIDAQSNYFGILSSLIYLGNWTRLWFPIYTTLQGFHGTLGVLNHTWSLAVEEQFYLIWPLLLLFLLGRRKHHGVVRMVTKGAAMFSITTTGLLILLAVWWRSDLYFSLLARISSGDAISYLRVYGGTDMRADEMLIGCLLALALSFGIIKPDRRTARLTACLLVPGLLWAGYVFVANLAPFDAWGRGLALLLALTIALTILHLVAAPRGFVSRVLSWTPLVKIGIVSYGIYLWHYVVFATIHTDSRDWLDWQPQVARLTVTAFCVILSYRYVETPMLRLKAKLRAHRPDLATNSSTCDLSTRQATQPGVSIYAEPQG